MKTPILILLDGIATTFAQVSGAPKPLAAEPIKAADFATLPIAAKKKQLASVGNTAAQPNMLLPLRTRFGTWRLASWDRFALREGFPFGDLTIYPAELRAIRGKNESEHSSREMKMVTLLHEKSGEVVSRDAMLDRCWGLEYYPESRTLDMVIAKLCKTIERDSANSVLIETIRGVGYRYRS